jgi:hypothetical protein
MNTTAQPSVHRSKCASFDHIVGAPEEGDLEANPERLGGRRQAAS